MKFLKYPFELLKKILELLIRFLETIISTIEISRDVIVEKISARIINYGALIILVTGVVLASQAVLVILYLNVVTK